MSEERYPLVTLAVLFYRHEPFVMDTVAGALSQTYPNLEIIFSDDHSPDNTFEAILDAIKDYKGLHKIIVNKNKENMGLIPHINKVLFELSHGDFIFLNGGDDVSVPERVSWSMDYFLSNSAISAVTGSNITIDKEGKKIGENLLDNDTILKIDDESYLTSSTFMTGGVALSFRRKVLDVFGRLNENCQTEDSVLRFRSMLLGQSLRSSKVFLKYRIHDNNISKDFLAFKTRLMASQYRKDLNVVRESLSPALFHKLVDKIDYFTKIREIQEQLHRCPKFFRPYYNLRIHFLQFYHHRL